MKTKIYKILVIVVTIVCFSCKATLEDTRESINLLVIGDWGWENSVEQKDNANIMKNIASNTQLDFIVSTGDNFYYDGVQSTTDPRWRDRFENIYNGSLLSKDWYATLGNHDYQGNVSAQLNYVAVNNRWKMPARYYSIERKITGFSDETALFVFLDTSPFDKGLHTNSAHPEVRLQDTTAQKRWLENTLATSKARWKLVFGHHPLYTAGVRKGTMGDFITALKPVFDKYQVDFYVSGHEHHLGHLKPDNNNTEYVISGGGGVPLTPVSAYNISRYSKSTFGFTDLKVKLDKISIDFINSQGETLYQFSKTK
jgi:tartrate-resistant acid phosphatase type 5